MAKPRHCPHCRALLFERGGMYRCNFCGKYFSEEELSKLPKSAMELRGRLKKARKAYDEAIEILDNLDKKENRELITRILRLNGYRNVKASDFEGATLDDSYFDGELSRRYGFRVFQLVIVIMPLKAVEVEKKFRSDPNTAIGGICIKVRHWPFSVLGGIRMSFYGEKRAALHEDIHASFNIYRGEEISTLTHELAETRILDEINSFKSELQLHDVIVKGDEESLKNYWKIIKKQLINNYVPKITKNLPNKEASQKFLKEKIDKIIPIMIKIQLEYDESVITRIILKSRSITDFENWSKRKAILDEWNERAIRGWENEAKKMIYRLVKDYDKLSEFDRSYIRRQAWRIVKEYWRFKGDPKDRKAANEYMDRLMDEVMKGHIEDKPKPRDEGKEGREFIRKLQKELGMKEMEEGKKEKGIVLKIEKRIKEKEKEREKKERDIVIKIKKRMEKNKKDD